jgi:mono/diheme cytochrome c family protein
VIKRRAGSSGYDDASSPFYRLCVGGKAVTPKAGDEAPRYLLAILAGAVLVAVGVVAAGCQGTHRMTAAERGAVIYRTNCSACHNENPNLPGPVGPAIAGSPKELIEARVLHGAYPIGYDPKRRTHIMKPLPWLGPHIDDLTAYLAAAKAEQG